MPHVQTIEIIQINLCIASDELPAKVIVTQNISISDVCGISRKIESQRVNKVLAVLSLILLPSQRISLNSTQQF